MPPLADVADVEVVIDIEGVTGWKEVFGLVERVIDFTHPGYRLVLSVRIIMIYNTFTEMSIQVKLWN